jgi:hypothetical protein
VNDKDGDRESERVVANDYTDEGEEEVEIEVEFAAIRATLVADPEGGSLEDPGYIQGDGHVSERNECDEDIVRLDVVYAATVNKAFGNQGLSIPVPTMPLRIWVAPRH